MDISFDVVIFPGGVPSLVLFKGILQGKLQIMGRQGETFSWRQHCSLTTFDFPTNNTFEASQWPQNLFQFLVQLSLDKYKTALLEAFYLLMVTYMRHNMACRTIISELAVAKFPAINGIYHQNMLQVFWQRAKRRRPIIVFPRILLWCTTCKNEWIILYVLLIAWNLVVTYIISFVSPLCQ